MIDDMLYRIASWASYRNIYWLPTLIYRFKCPNPIEKDHSVQACIKAGHCGCNNRRDLPDRLLDGVEHNGMPEAKE